MPFFQKQPFQGLNRKRTLPTTWKKSANKAYSPLETHDVPIEEVHGMSSVQESKSGQKKILMKNILKEGFRGNSKAATEYYVRPELIEDIRKNGLKNPITLNQDANGNFAVGDGHHRYIAAQRLGFTHIPAIVLPHQGNIFPWEKGGDKFD
jgi:hypothetical protein